MFHRGALKFFGESAALAGHAAFLHLLEPLRASNWVVYAKPPFGSPADVIDYLGRYTHRVAISNDRLLSLDNGQVTFRWKDYRHARRSRTMTIPAPEFIRRFLLHALPDGFQRIRFGGFLANRHRRAKLALISELLSTPMSDLLPSREDTAGSLAQIAGPDVIVCSVCGHDAWVRIEYLAASAIFFAGQVSLEAPACHRYRIETSRMRPSSFSAAGARSKAHIPRLSFDLRFSSTRVHGRFRLNLLSLPQRPPLAQ